jgi:hypothetical protein
MDSFGSAELVPASILVVRQGALIGKFAMLLCSICGTRPRQFLLLKCDDCGALCCLSCSKKVTTASTTRLCCERCGSQHVHDTLANNWNDFPGLLRPIPWKTATAGKPHIVFEAEVDADQWELRMNDFPDEPLYTLLINDRPIIHFDNWPSVWAPRPPFPV